MIVSAQNVATRQRCGTSLNSRSVVAGTAAFDDLAADAVACAEGCTELLGDLGQFRSYDELVRSAAGTRIPSTFTAMAPSNVDGRGGHVDVVFLQGTAEAGDSTADGRIRVGDQAPSPTSMRCQVTKTHVSGRASKQRMW